jgi:chaperonin GroEL (HSP60 family)
MIGEDSFNHFFLVQLGATCTIVIRGTTKQMLDEPERSLRYALCGSFRSHYRHYYYHYYF